MWQSSQYYKKLRLGELPLLPVIEIVKSMRLKDQINLALSSKKFEAVCSIARVKVEWFFFHVRDEYTRLDLGKSISLCCGDKESNVNGIEKISYQKLSKWLATGSSATSLQRLVCLSERINTIFRSKNIHLSIYLDRMKNASVKDIMDVPMFKNCEKITLVRGEIESDDLRLVLDMAKNLKYFRIFGTKVPSDFQHERVFSIQSFEYEDAKWVKLENLLTMRNSIDVTLGTTSLTYLDFNQFLKFWVNSEVDMFVEFCIKMEENISLQVLFDGLLRLDSSRFDVPTYFIIAGSTMVNRKNPFLYVQYTHGRLKFWAPTEKEPFQSEIDALRILEKQAKLRKKMEGIENLDQNDMRRMKALDMQLNELLAEGKFIIGE